MKEQGDEIIGKRVRVVGCEAEEHGNNSGCVCNLIGEMVTIKKKFDTPFVGTASYHIKGSNKRVRRSEVVLPRKKKVDRTETEICKKTAEIYAGEDWHKLSPKERELVKLLEKGGYIIPNKPDDGFVGKIA